MTQSKYIIEVEQEEDYQWIAEVIALPGVMAYGWTQEHAVARAGALALRVLADHIERGEIAGLDMFDIVSSSRT